MIYACVLSLWLKGRQRPEAASTVFGLRHLWGFIIGQVGRLDRHPHSETCGNNTLFIMARKRPVAFMHQARDRRQVSADALVTVRVYHPDTPPKTVAFSTLYKGHFFSVTTVQGGVF